MQTSAPIVGIDVAKDSCCYAVLAPDSSVYLEPFSLSNDKEGLFLVLQKLEKVEQDFNTKPSLVLESTGHYSNRLVHFFLKNEFKVYLVNPLLSHSIKSSTVRKVKNDKVDALDLARLFFIMDLKEYESSNDSMENLKILARTYSHLSEQRTSAINQFSATLEQVMPDYSKVFNNSASKTSLELLRQYPSPQLILAAPKEEIISLIKLGSRKSLDYAQKKYCLLMDCVKNAFFLKVPFEAYSDALVSYVQNIIHLNNQLDSLSHKMDDLSIHIPEINLLLSIPGIGKKLATVICSEIGSISRFKSAKQLVAYCGIDPSVKQSGKFMGSKNRLTKRGSPYIRKALYMAAIISVSKNPNGTFVNSVMHEYYQKKISSKAKKQALGAVMNKIVKIIYSVLKNQHTFIMITPEEQIKMYKQNVSVVA